MTETVPLHIAKQISAATAPRQTKAAMVRAHLAEPGGASMTEMMLLTGWRAHTLRAALTGLRKTGLSITRNSEGGETIYAINSTGPAHTPYDGIRKAAEAAEAAEASPGIDANVLAVPTATPDGNAVNLIVDSSQGAA